MIDDSFSFQPEPFALPFCETAAAIHKTGFDFPWSRESFESLLLLPTTKGWIIPSGLLICSQVCDEMEILTICIVPDFRRKGLGTKWLHFLTNYAQENGIKRIFLEVSVENISAQALYKKNGFELIGTRKNYYKTKTGFCDALCMEKKIINPFDDT